jgi:hypothetical protein
MPGNTDVFYLLLGCGRDNAIGIFRKIPFAVALTGRTISMQINFLGSECSKHRDFPNTLLI